MLYSAVRHFTEYMYVEIEEVAILPCNLYLTMSPDYGLQFDSSLHHCLHACFGKTYAGYSNIKPELNMTHAHPKRPGQVVLPVHTSEKEPFSNKEAVLYQGHF